MFFNLKKSLKNDTKESNLFDTFKDLGLKSIKSYAKGALLGAIIKKPDFKTMNQSGIKMVKLDLFRNSLTQFFDHFLCDSIKSLEPNIDYMPLSAFIAGATIGINDEELIYDWNEPIIKNEFSIKSRLLSGISYSALSVIEKLILENN